MKSVLFVDTRSHQEESLFAPGVIKNLTLYRARGMEAAESMFQENPATFETVLLAWEPSSGVDIVDQMVCAANALDLEVIAVVPRREAVKAEEAIAAGVFWVVTVPCDAMHLRRVLKAAAETGELRQEITDADRECDVLLGLLNQGSFQFREPREARILAERLGRLCPEPQASVALLELMINSIEHGNLEIDYKLKGALLAQGLFEMEVEKRLKEPRFQSRYARLDVTKQGKDSLELLLTDAGSGFDWARYQVMEDERILDLHGRGVLLASATLNIEYQAPGNRVKIQMPLTMP